MSAECIIMERMKAWSKFLVLEQIFKLGKNFLVCANSKLSLEHPAIPINQEIYPGYR